MVFRRHNLQNFGSMRFSYSVQRFLTGLGLGLILVATLGAFVPLLAASSGSWVTANIQAQPPAPEGEGGDRSPSPSPLRCRQMWRGIGRLIASPPW